MPSATALRCCCPTRLSLLASSRCHVLAFQLATRSALQRPPRCADRPPNTHTHKRCGRIVFHTVKPERSVPPPNIKRTTTNDNKTTTKHCSISSARHTLRRETKRMGAVRVVGSSYCADLGPREKLLGAFLDEDCTSSLYVAPWSRDLLHFLSYFSFWLAVHRSLLPVSHSTRCASHAMLHSTRPTFQTPHGTAWHAPRYARQNLRRQRSVIRPLLSAMPRQQRLITK